MEDHGVLAFLNELLASLSGMFLLYGLLLCAFDVAQHVGGRRGSHIDNVLEMFLINTVCSCNGRYRRIVLGTVEMGALLRSCCVGNIHPILRLRTLRF